MRGGKIWLTSFASPVAEHARLCDLVLPARRQVADHLQSDAHAVRDGPRARVILKDREFERKRISMRVDEAIHAARVGCEICPVLRRQRAGVLLCKRRDSKPPRFAIQSRVVARPTTSDNSPAAARRIMSICHKRSCAVM